MTENPTGFDRVAVADVLVSAAKATGWEVLALDDDAVLATMTAHYGDRHVVSIKPTAADFPARRSINDESTDATSQFATVLEWIIKPAIKSAELRGSEGEFTD
jgi:hypothetical protein